MSDRAPAPDPGRAAAGMPADDLLAIVDHAPVLLRACARDGSCVWCNHGWLEFTGSKLDEQLGDSWVAAIHPEDRTAALTAWDDAREPPRPVRLEYRLRHADGEYRWILDRTEPTFDAAGAVLGYLASCVDVTEQRSARIALERRALQRAAVVELGSRALAGSAFGSLAEHAVAVLAELLDVELAIVLLRTRGDALYPIASVGFDVPMPVLTTEPSLTAASLHAEDAIVVSDWATESRFERSELLRAHGVEAGCSVAIRTPTGPVGVLGSHTRAPRRFTEDDVNFMRNVANVLGATLARERLEAELRASESRLQLALAAGRMGTWEWDPDTGAVTWSAQLEQLYGLEPGGFEGTTDAFLAHVHPDDRSMVAGMVQGALEQGTPIAMDHRIVWPDGSTHWLEGRGALLRDPGSGTERWLGVGIEIDDRKTIEAERVRFVAEREHLLRAEQAMRSELEQTVARLDALLEHSPVAFGFFDTDLRFVGVNAPLAEIDGAAVAEHPGRTLADLVPQLAPLVEPAMRRVLERGTPVVNVEVSGQTPAMPGIERHFLDSIYPVVSGGGQVLGVGLVVVDITEQKRAELRSRLVALVSDLAARGEDLGEILQEASDIVVPELADFCCLMLFPTEDAEPLVTVAHVDPSMREAMLAADAQTVFDVATFGTTAAAARDGTVQLVEHVSPERVRERLAGSPVATVVEDLDVTSFIAAPLVTRGRTSGLALLGHSAASGRRYRPGDASLAEELVRRFAQIVDGVRLVEDAERSRARLAMLARAGELIELELDPDARLQRFVELSVPSFCDMCALHLVEDDGSFTLTHLGVADEAARRRVGSRERWPGLPADAPSANVDAVRTRAAVLASEPGPELLGALGARRAAAVAELGIRSLLCAPLQSPDGEVFGTITFVQGRSGRRFTPDDVPVAEELASRAAASFHHAVRFEQQRMTAETLQRSLLPERLPEVADLDIAARYVPGGDGPRIGGDWYDVIPTRGGRVLLVIGDVVGHGLPAASSMGRLRAGLQLCANDGLGPAEILDRLNRYVFAVAEADIATLAIVLHDPASGSLRYASAGHPPPLLADAHGGSVFLEGGLGLPLRASETATYHEAEATLDPGMAVVLYTDGLVERRNEPLDVGLERLRSTVARADGESERLADALLGRLVPEQGPDDDVALLVARAAPIGRPLELVVDAQPRALAAMRRTLRTWLARNGVPADLRDDLCVAANEVAANAVEHAYDLHEATFVLRAGFEGSDVVVTVADTGRWRARTPGPERGRGLALVRALVDGLDVQTGDGGTLVTLRRAVPQETLV